MFLRAFGLVLAFAWLFLPSRLAAELTLSATVRAPQSLEYVTLKPARSTCAQTPAIPSKTMRWRVLPSAGVEGILPNAGPWEILLRDRGRLLVVTTPPILCPTRIAPIQFPSLIRLSAKILDESGSPLAGARLRSYGADLGEGARLAETSTLTSEDGDALLWLTDEEIDHLFVEGYEITKKLRSRNHLDLTLSPSDTPTSHSLADAHKRRQQPGRVIDIEGRPIEGAYAWTPKEPECWSVTNREGRFQLDGALVDHPILIGSPGSEIVGFNNGTTSAQSTARLAPATGAFAFQLKDSFGRPIRDARVEMVDHGWAGFSTLDGRLVLRGVAAHRVGTELHITHPDHVELRRKWSSVLTDQIPDVRIAWKLDRPTLVVGRLLDAQSRPITDAQVELQGEPNQHLLTDSNGAFELRGLGSGIHLARIETASGETGWLSFETSPEGGRLQLEPFLIRPSEEIWGRVTNFQGDPIAGVSIHLHQLDDRQATVNSFGETRAPVIARTEADGYFRIDGFPEVGKIRLGFVKHGFSSRVELFDLSQAGSPTEAVETQLLALSPVKIRVTSKTSNEPIAAAGLLWSHSNFAGGTGSSERTGHLVTGADGQATLLFSPMGEPKISVDHPDFVGIERRLSQREIEAGEVVFEMAPATRFMGRAVDQQGKPIQGLRVNAQLPAHQTHSLGSSSTTDVHGAFELSGLSPGARLELMFRDPRIGTVSRWINVSEVVDEVEFVLPLQQLRMLAGVAQWNDGLPVANMPLALRGATGNEWIVMTDDSGGFRHGSLPQGRYALDLRAHRRPIQPVAGQEVDLDDDISRWIVVFDASDSTERAH